MQTRFKTFWLQHKIRSTHQQLNRHYAISHITQNSIWKLSKQIIRYSGKSNKKMEWSEAI